MNLLCGVHSLALAVTQAPGGYGPDPVSGGGHVAGKGGHEKGGGVSGQGERRVDPGRCGYACGYIRSNPV